MIDSQQFEAFMKAYQNMVFTTAVRLLGSETEAEDVSQEVFLKAYERFAELKDSPTVAGWLKTVATNMSLNHLTRYRARWSFFSEIFSQTEEGDEREIEFPESRDFEAELASADRSTVL